MGNIYCTNCGASMTDDSIFCMECGFRLDADVQPARFTETPVSGSISAGTAKYVRSAALLWMTTPAFAAYAESGMRNLLHSFLCRIRLRLILYCLRLKKGYVPLAVRLSTMIQNSAVTADIYLRRFSGDVLFVMPLSLLAAIPVWYAAILLIPAQS